MPDFTFHGSSLHYTCTGSGKRVLWVFHGFGQTLRNMDVLVQQLSEQFTVYSFDLFFHGQSVWGHKEKTLSKLHWKALVEAFLIQEKIDKFSVLGFSMGGKFAFATLESFPARIEELLLIAPDGVKTNFWYSLATYPSWAKKAFRSVVIQPRRFQQLALWMRRLRVVDKGVVRFAQSQMNTREKRHRVYFSWMVFKELAFDMSYIAELIKQYRMGVSMFIGKYDKIITEPNIRPFLEKIPDHTFIVLESGHNRLVEAVAEYYAKEFSVHKSL